MFPAVLASGNTIASKSGSLSRYQKLLREFKALSKSGIRTEWEDKANFTQCLNLFKAKRQVIQGLYTSWRQFYVAFWIHQNVREDNMNRMYMALSMQLLPDSQDILLKLPHFSRICGVSLTMGQPGILEAKLGDDPLRSYYGVS